jgi:phosphoribosylformylglycinamidine synthase
MSLAVPPENVDAFLALARRREVEATVLGTFTDSGYFVARHGDQIVARISLRFLHDGAPTLDLEATWTPPRFDAPPAGRPTPDAATALLGLLAEPAHRSNARLARTYDHEVKGLTVVRPLVGVHGNVPSEGSVLMVRHGSRRGYVLSEAVDPFLSDLDAYAMAQAVVDEALRKNLAAGATLDRVAMLDNFCWPDPVQSDRAPDGAYKAAQLVRACRGLAEAVMAYGTPLVSGKDSMKNDSWMGGVKISVPPTLLVSAIGQIPDVLEALSLEPKVAGDHVYVLGPTDPALGGCAYGRWLGAWHGEQAPLGAPAPYVDLGGGPPRLALHETLPRYAALEHLVRRGVVRSIAVPARGGLGLCFARMAIAGGLGLALELDGIPCAARTGAAPLDVHTLLFAESLGRLVLTVAPEHRAEVEAALGPHVLGHLGRVSAAPTLALTRGGAPVLALDVAALEATYVAAEEALEARAAEETPRHV